MLNKIDMTARGFHLSAIERDYINTRVGETYTYIPRQARKTAYADVIVKKGNANGHIAFLAEIILHLPKSPLTAHAAGTSVEESIDLAESKLKAQVAKYKEKKVSFRAIRHKLSRIGRKSA